MIHLDFETYSETHDVTVVGAFRYAHAAEITLASWQYDDGEDIHTWELDDPEPKELIRRIESGEKICAHNAEFEYCILKYSINSFTRKVKVTQLICTASMAARCALPRKLKHVVPALGLPSDVEKDKRGQRLITKFCSPCKPTKKHPSTRWYPEDAPEEWEEFKEYNRQDVIAEYAVYQALPKLRKYDQQVYWMTVRINERGIPIDLDSVRLATEFLEGYVAELVKEFRELSGGLNPTQVQKITQLLGLPNLQEKTIQKYRDKLPAHRRRMADIRLMVNKASVKKFQSMLATADLDYRAHGTLMYHGARNGRYTGQFMQPQNFKRGYEDESRIDDVFEALQLQILDLLYADPIGELANCIRGFIRAEDGNTLLIADYTAIEYYIFVWLSEQNDILELLHKGMDAYKDMAAYIFGVDYDDVTDEQRRIGKNTVLGCIYQMAEERFYNQAQQQGATDVTIRMAAHAVNSFRKKYDKAGKFWYGIERAAVKCLHTKQPIKFKQLTFHINGDFLCMRLPSGRDIFFYKARIKNTGFSDQIEYLAVKGNSLYWKTIYGGLFTENACSGIATDIMINGMFNAEKDGFPLIFTVHDELIVEEDESIVNIEGFSEVISDVQDWAKEIPIKAKGIVTPRYRKG